MSTPLRVLIVADSTDDTTLLLKTLRDGDYEPLWERVETAAALSAALKRQSWELVICDDALPHFDALAVLRLLQEKGLDLPFVIVADTISEETAVTFMKAGAHDYVMKDNLVRLVPAIERELRQARNRRMHQQMSQEVTKRGDQDHSSSENSSDLLTILAADATVRFTSPSSACLLGYQPTELLGANLFAYVHPDDESHVRAALAQVLDSPGVPHPLQLRVRHRQGSWHTLEAVSTSFHDDAGVATIIVNAHETAIRGTPTASLRYQALHDALKDFSNRALFHDHLQQAICTAQQKNKPLVLLLVSLDRVREINKTFGHQWGDALFEQANARLWRTLRKSDTLVRIDGNEFAMLLPFRRDAAAATPVARRLLRALEEPFVIDGHSLAVRAHIGIVLYPEHGTDAQTLMRRADIALDIAARTNRGYALYTADQDHYSRDRLMLVGELRDAIKQDQLLLHYQPKAHLRTDQVSHAEALVRWVHPQRGLLPPDQFIPIAERSGLIKPLSLWVLNAALRQCRAWQQEGLDLHIAINLSMRDLQDAQLPKTIARLLESCGIASTCLEVEITESALAEDPERALKTLMRLRAMGVHIAIDDFGTGYSSLAYLKQLPADEIKIDKSFVLNMAQDENSAAIVRSTIELGHDLGLTVTAEGVEDQTTWDILVTFGCDLVQGYYLSRPIPAAAFARWLKESPWKMSPHSGEPLAPLRLPRGRGRAVSGSA